MAETHSFVTIKLPVRGFHYWIDAPQTVGFLSYQHRHTFTIRASVYVRHGDRCVEFVLFRQLLLKYLTETYPVIFDGYNFGMESCENLSKAMHDWLVSQKFSVRFVSFSEDEEFEGGVETVQIKS